MRSYVLRRLGWTVVVVWCIVTVTFTATQLSPVDPARAFVGGRATTAQLEQTRRDLGLDRSLPVQYARYVSHVVRGDLGQSIATGASVGESLVDRAPRTALLAIAALILQVVIGVPLGILAALRHRQLTDRFVLAGSLIGVVVPSFVLGFLLLYVFAYKLSWFPLGGTDRPSAIVLPALTLGLAGAGWYARMTRAAFLEIRSTEYVRLARAKGLPARLVVGRHMLRNAASPLITMGALDLGVFVGGVLVIERVFAWPGIGDQAWRAISVNDVPLILGTVLTVALAVTLLNLIADVVNAFIDPRIRYA
jgi:peptide/nickel transport system permease protein